MESTQQRLKIALQKELFQRSQNGAIAQLTMSIVFAGTTFFFISEFNGLYLLLPFFIFMTSFLRLHTARYLSFKKSQKDIVYLHHISTLGQSLFWGLTAFFILKIYRANSVEAVFTFILISGIAAGAMFSLLPSPRLHFSFYGILFTIPTLSFLFHPVTHVESFLTAIFIIFFVFLFAQSRQHFSDLRENILRSFALEEEHARMQMIFNSAPGFILWLDNKSKVLGSTQNLDKHFQFNLNEEKTIHGEKQEHPLFQVIQKFIESNDLSFTKEFEFMYDGEPTPFVLSFQKFQNQKAIDEVILTAIPIRELKKARQELSLQTAKAQYSSKLATLGEMAGGMAHEINNPLAIIRANCEQALKLAQREPEKNLPRIYEKLNKAIETCERIYKIIQGLRLFSRQADNENFEIVDLSEIVQNTLELCRERFYRFGVNLLAETTPSIQLECRPTQISQVLLNLLNNAFDATLERPNKWIRLEFKTRKDVLEIRVSDSGTGVPLKIQEKIFEPFFTTKGPGHGMGLGLSISKGIIEDHHGRIMYKDDLGLPTFVMQIPLRQPNQNQSTAA